MGRARAAVRQVTASKRRAKLVNPPTFAHALGLRVRREGRDYRMTCPNPDHDGPTPRMSGFRSNRYGEVGTWKWICYSCGWPKPETNIGSESPKPGDNIEVVQALRGVTFQEAIDYLCDLADRDPPDPLPPPATTERQRAEERAHLQDRYDGAAADTPSSVRAIRRFCASKGMEARAGWAQRVWQLQGEQDGTVLFPYWARAGGGEGQRSLVGLVRRSPYDGYLPRMVSGSQGSGAFFGEHLDAGHEKVVLTEGETDTLAVSWWFRRLAVDVLGVRHAGATPDSRMIERLTGRTVYLLMDADEAGRQTAQVWTEVLADACTVKVADLPDGMDAREAGRETVLDALYNTN